MTLKKSRQLSNAKLGRVSSVGGADGNIGATTEICSIGAVSATKNKKPSIRDCSLRWLARREYSAKELRDKLFKQGFSQFEIAKELADLASRNWQSDERFAENFVASRLHAGLGPKRIEQELMAKGVNADLIEKKVYGRTIDWEHLAKQVLQQKQKARSLDLVHQQRFLYMRGFSFDQIKAAVKGLMIDEIDELT